MSLITVERRRCEPSYVQVHAPFLAERHLDAEQPRTRFPTEVRWQIVRLRWGFVSVDESDQ